VPYSLKIISTGAIKAFPSSRMTHDRLQRILFGPILVHAAWEEGGERVRALSRPEKINTSKTFDFVA
jgi:hypothetical protein